MLGVRPCQETIAAFRRRQSENWILLVRRFAGEIDARGQPFEDSASKDRNVNVRRLEHVSVSRHAARLDGCKRTGPVCVRGQASKPVKRGINGLVLLVLGMMVLAFGIRLP